MRKWVTETLCHYRKYSRQAAWGDLVPQTKLNEASRSLKAGNSDLLSCILSTLTFILQVATCFSFVPAKHCPSSTGRLSPKVVLEVKSNAMYCSPRMLPPRGRFVGHAQPWWGSGSRTVVVFGCGMYVFD